MRRRPRRKPDKAEIGKALTSPQFLVLGFTFMLCCAAHSGPIFHVVSYAMYCGLGSMAAVSVYSVEGLAGLGGRVVIGLLADRFGAKRAADHHAGACSPWPSRPISR